jgi:transcription elongation factor Elf1
MMIVYRTSKYSKKFECPKCGEKEDIGWNWLGNDDGSWGHECYRCENVFETEKKYKKQEVKK